VGFRSGGERSLERSRLKDVLSRADVRPDTVEVVLNGADRPVLDGTPRFAKSVPLDKALDEHTLIAYEMALPFPTTTAFRFASSCPAGPPPTG
jgi:hypothetical protein